MESSIIFPPLPIGKSGLPRALNISTNFSGYAKNARP